MFQANSYSEREEWMDGILGYQREVENHGKNYEQIREIYQKEKLENQL